MDLLDWARGPLLSAALAVFVVGVIWRLFVLWRMPSADAGAPPRRAFSPLDAARAALAGLWPRKGLGAKPGDSATLVTINPYVFHIGLALIVFGYAPHIAFARRLTGLGWPALPDAVVYFAVAATIVSLLLALMFRLTDPALKKISRPGDWVAWGVTMLPLLTGMAVVGEPSSSLLATVHLAQRDPVAIHLLSVELLLVWFPFGKLMHAFLFLPGRMQLASFLGRRGVHP
jgi:nitrate reductase gamma subunit